MLPVQTGPEAAAGAADLLRSAIAQVAEVGAEADGLRADLDAVLADLDMVRADLHTARANLETARSERDRHIGEYRRLAVEAEKQNLDLARALSERARMAQEHAHEREAGQRELDQQHELLAAAHREIDALLVDRDRIGRAAADHRRRRAEADQGFYRAELAERARAESDARRHWELVDALQQGAVREAETEAEAARRLSVALAAAAQQSLAAAHELAAARELAAAAEAAHGREAARADALAAQLRATQDTVSWRVTRPLRAARKVQLGRAPAPGPAASSVSADGSAEVPTAAVPSPALPALPALPTPLAPARPVPATGPAPSPGPRPAAEAPLPAPDPEPASAVADEQLVDLEYYRDRYPDLRVFDDAGLREHFVLWGRHEGRQGLSWIRSSLILRPPGPDDRQRVLVLLHDARPTDAPALPLILDLAERYHVVSVLLGGGPLEESIAAASGTTVVLDRSRDLAPDEARVLATELRRLADPVFAVTHSIASYRVAIALEAAGVPVVGLVELVDGSADPGGLSEYFATLSGVVYADEAVARSAAAQFPTALGRGQGSAVQGQEHDAGRYAQVVEDLGQQAARERRHAAEDLRTLLTAGAFDGGLFSGGQADQGTEQLARAYLRQVQVAAPLRRPRTGLVVQRPRPGFHPLAYAESAPGFIDDGRDPLAHYLRAGQPPGRWAKRLIVPDGAAPQGSGAVPSVLVHGHFHYPDDVPELLDLLATIRTPVALVLTATTAQVAEQIEALAREHPAARPSRVLVVPNRGRNLSALLSGPVAALLGDHDVVLHVHGKRSPHLDPELGRRWRNYLWAHLIGAGYPLADQVIAQFAASPRLGLVAPEDRNLHDWDLNREPAQALALRLGREMDLPVHFDFPLGAMFWARTAALQPFLAARLGDQDYPPEPLPHDGTALHALERLIPLVIEDDGFEFAKTHVPSVRR